MGNNFDDNDIFLKDPIITVSNIYYEKKASRPGLQRTDILVIR